MKHLYHIRLSPTRVAVADLMELPCGCWMLTRINVPHGFRGRGHGSELLEEVLNDADAEEVTLKLTINPYGGLNYDQLQSWYERRGFQCQIDDEGPVFVRRPNQ